MQRPSRSTGAASAGRGGTGSIPAAAHPRTAGMAPSAAAGPANPLPVVQAVLAGAVDTVENVCINLQSLLPLPRRRAAELDACLGGKVVIVTGANAGIGYATARKLAQRGASVVLACRSRERGGAAAQALSCVEPLPGCPAGSVEYAQLDLGSLSSVKRFAKAFNASGRRLDVLVCNAGIMSPPQRLTTDDGHEMQFQVNFLSHWLLAHELLAEQRRRRAKAARKQGRRNGSANADAGCACGGAVAACKDAGGGANCGTRLVMLSSLTHHAGQLQWHDKESATQYSPFTSYACSKLSNTIIAAEFQRRFDRHDPSVYGRDSAVAIHPGVVNTALATNFFSNTSSAALPWLAHAVQPLLRCVFPLLLRSPDSSADCMLAAAMAPAARVAGRYMHNDRLSRPNKFAEDPERGQELWALATELTDVTTHPSLA